MMTAPKPNIVWRGSPNFWHGRIDDRGRSWAVIAIVDHIMVGTQESTDGWFKNPASQASSTFGVAKDGRIWQWVKEDDTHWGNGLLQSPDMSVGWIAECANKQINPNYRTIAIEHEGWPGDVFPESQYQTTLALHRWLLATYNIPADRQHINGHYQLMKIDKANCPGPSFPWTRLMGDLQPVAPPPDITDPNSGADVWHCLQTDKWVLDDHGFLTYWRLNGRLAQFGYPISGAVADSKGVITQWFERARFEYHPDTHSILLGLVGSELLAKL